MLSYTELLNPTDARVKKILEAGERHFLAHGLYKSNIGRICEDAGISKPTFYKYFDKKETLFFAVLIYLQRIFFEDYAIKSAEAKNATDKLKLYLDLYEQYFHTNKLLAQASPYNKDLRGSWSTNPLSSEFYLYSVDFIESIIEEGITRGEFRVTDARKTAHMIALISSVFFVFEPRGQNYKKTNHSYAEFIGDLVLNGVKKPA